MYLFSGCAEICGRESMRNYCHLVEKTGTAFVKVVKDPAIWVLLIWICFAFICFDWGFVEFTYIPFFVKALTH